MLYTQSMNEWNTSLLKYISHFILISGLLFVVSLRDRWRDIHSDMGLLLVLFLLPEARGYQRLHPHASHIIRRSNPLISCVSLAWISILCILSKSDHVIIMWSPSGYTLAGSDCPNVLSFPCLLITTWQLVKADGVTRKKLKIHVIYNIKQIYTFTPVYEHTSFFLYLNFQFIFKL